MAADTTMRSAIMAVTGIVDAWAGCEIKKMLRVVFRDVTPGGPGESVATGPTTIYRIGTRYGRVEESPDPAEGIHGLVIVNDADS